MKRHMKYAIFLLCLMWVALIPGQSHTLLAQSAPLTFRFLSAPAPNKYTAVGGVAWTAYQNWAPKAMQAIEDGKGNSGDPGSDPSAFELIPAMIPRYYAVSSHPSWRGLLNPKSPFNDQYGNAMHFLLHVKGDGTVRFKVEDLSWCVWTTGTQGAACTNMALTPPHSSGAWDRVDCSFGWGYDWGADKKKGGGDDTKVCGGDQQNRGSIDATLIDELFYVGASYAHDAVYRYNDPVNWPEYKDYTLQELFDDYCKTYNSDANLKEIGLEFTIVASDGNSYKYVAKRGNPEFGKPLQPGLCRPYPEVKKQKTIHRQSRAAEATAVPAPKVHTCLVLLAQGYSFKARYGLTSGVQCNLVDASAIGIQSVIDAGLIDAVDVWGYAEQGVEVCIPRQGRSGVLLFLDANTSPKAPQPLVSYYRGDSICASINGPGTIVFVAAWTGAPEPTTAEADSTSLPECMVTTTALLNFRDGPGGEIIGYVPNTASLTALARTDGWFQVDNNGVSGWISAEYVTTDGACG